jgi:hypothetical protein
MTTGVSMSHEHAVKVIVLQCCNVEDWAPEHNLARDHAS